MQLSEIVIEFLHHVKGEKGDPGSTGPYGNPGCYGKKGADGKIGAPGDPGLLVHHKHS